MSSLIECDRPAVLLAPMEGVTDAAMRALLSELGGLAGCVSEFLRISQQVPPTHTFFAHCPELHTANQTSGGTPIVLQLLGGDPDKMAKAAAHAVTLGARAIDLNFGCPARTVNRHDGGAALLRAPKRIRAITRAVRDALPQNVTVSVKLRLGWDSPDDLLHNAEAAIAGGAQWLTVHGRTKAQGYKPWANWAPIAALNRIAPVPIVANGDIFSVSDAARCFEITGCKHLMLGRGAVADPSLAMQVARLMGLHQQAVQPAKPCIRTWTTWIRRLGALSARNNVSAAYLPGRIKQWGKMNHLYGGGFWYHHIKTCSTLQEMMLILERLAIGER